MVKALRDGVLIPYQQGGLFRLKLMHHEVRAIGLNPLSAGRSFQTNKVAGGVNVSAVLIPYQQGGLFRLIQNPQLIVLPTVLIPYQQGGLFRRFQGNKYFTS